MSFVAVLRFLEVLHESDLSNEDKKLFGDVFGSILLFVAFWLIDLFLSSWET